MAGDSTDKDNGEQRSNTDTTGEFFSVGMPLHAVRAGYVRRRADDQLYDAVMAGRYAHVVAPDRSGKSSLIAATAARLESNGHKVAILDLEQIGDRDGGTDSGRWYYSVAYRLLRQLRIRYDLQSWWQDKNILSNRQRLFEFYSEVILQHVDSRIVVFVDEIQCIEDLPYADQIGYSDMTTGVSVVFLQDWAVNAELEKFFSCRDKALAIIYHLRAQSDPSILDGLGF